MDVNINIKIDSKGAEVHEESDSLEIMKKRKKLGTEAVLKMPYNQGTYDKPSKILDLLGA